jgi:hypothetical protein
LRRLVCLQMWKTENWCCCPNEDANDKRVCFLGFLRQRLARYSKGLGDQEQEMRSKCARWQTHVSWPSPRTWLGCMIETQKSRHERFVADLLLDDRFLIIPKCFQGRASQRPNEHERRAQYKRSAELSGEFASTGASVVYVTKL